MATTSVHGHDAIDAPVPNRLAKLAREVYFCTARNILQPPSTSVGRGRIVPHEHAPTIRIE